LHSGVQVRMGRFRGRLMSLLLLSGGIESTTLAYALRPTICLTIDYGQTVAESELAASVNVCKVLRLSHTFLRIDLRRFAAGTMAGMRASPLRTTPEWWPFRNQILISVAAMVAFKKNEKEILIGTVRSDRQHKDGSRGFLKSMDRLLRNQEGAIRLNAPASRMSSEDLLDQAQPPLSLLGLTFSCHRSNYSCGQCRGCWKNESCVAHAILKSKEEARESRRVRQA
jgi:7-cyano-7-deazaguanine synthase